jgi:fructosamine-3-kinase
MSLPLALGAKLRTILGPIAEIAPVGGGDISPAARIELPDGRQGLVKWRSGPPAGLFTAERQGLELLRAARVLRVPNVLAQGEAEAACPAFIVLEWLEPAPAAPKTGEALGHGLAALHRVTAATYGLDHDNFIGANPQPNTPRPDWVTFFREQRLGFQVELAGQNGYLPSRRARLLEKLLARLDEWLPARPPASLLHGDLWGGNWLTTTSGEPALIDPAVYYGHREADLAFTRLFGGFPPAFYAAYQQSWPLAEGHEARQALYNLYHLLNHLNLFGETYGEQVDTILRRYGG